MGTLFPVVSSMRLIFTAGKPDEDAIARGEKALPDVIRIVEGKLAKSKWLLGNDFTLVDCAYAPILNITEKAGFSFEEFPNVRAYMEAIRSRSSLAGNSQASGTLESPADRTQRKNGLCVRHQ